MISDQTQFEQKLQNELVGAITRRNRGADHRRRKLVGITVALTLIGVGFASFAAFALLKKDHQHLGPRTMLGQPSSPQHAYPAVWKVDGFDQASARLSFPVLVPHAKDANPGNLVASFVFPGRTAVAFDFPQPVSQASSKAAPVRQTYIEVWESPWREGNATKALQQDVVENPDAGKSYCQIDNNPAECSTPHSGGDNNPAFVRAVIDGVEIHAYGGDNLPTLVAIVGSLRPIGD
jgi:hypothetical protein